MFPSLANVRNQKVNQKWAGKPCAKCNFALALGDNASICAVCGAAHHQQCWVSNNGCSGDPSCVNAPPPVEALEKKGPVSSDEIECPTAEARMSTRTSTVTNAERYSTLQTCNEHQERSPRLFAV